MLSWRIRTGRGSRLTPRREIRSQLDLMRVCRVKVSRRTAFFTSRGSVVRARVSVLRFCVQSHRQCPDVRVSLLAPPDRLRVRDLRGTTRKGALHGECHSVEGGGGETARPMTLGLHRCRALSFTGGHIVAFGRSADNPVFGTTLHLVVLSLCYHYI